MLACGGPRDAVIAIPLVLLDRRALFVGSPLSLLISSGLADQLTSAGTLERERIADVHRLRFDNLLAGLDAVAAASPFRPARAALQMRRCHRAGVEAGESAEGVLEVIMEALAGHQCPAVVKAAADLRGTP